jgi:outer membrane lipoprotein carrier protein
MTLRTALLATLLLASPLAQADALQALRDFAQNVRSGKASFTQTVSSPDGAKKKSASGHFEFLRPNRFRFVYSKPFEQQIVADGQKVWLYDLDLQQVTVRPLGQALGATPAALLAGTALEKDFELSAQPDRDGLQWAQAVPRLKDGSIQSIRVGFDKAGQLAAMEITDAFGQRSLLQFAGVQANVKLADDHFRFQPPKGVDVVEAPR